MGRSATAVFWTQAAKSSIIKNLKNFLSHMLSKAFKPIAVAIEALMILNVFPQNTRYIKSIEKKALFALLYIALKKSKLITSDVKIINPL